MNKNVQKLIYWESMKEWLNKLTEVERRFKEGDESAAKELLSSEISLLKGQAEELRHPSGGDNEVAGQLSILEKRPQLYIDDLICLQPINTQLMAEQYLQVRKENAINKLLYDEERGRKIEMDSVLEDSTFYCGIYSVPEGSFVGFCGINNIFAEELELAIEILKEYQKKGYACRSLKAFMDTVEKEVGCTHFIAKVDADNKASRNLMKKIGFVPAGITTFLIKDEERLLQLEEDNLECLTDDIAEAAAEFGVEPRKLLSHLLVYSIDLITDC